MHKDGKLNFAKVSDDQPSQERSNAKLSFVGHWKPPSHPVTVPLDVVKVFGFLESPGPAGSAFDQSALQDYADSCSANTNNASPASDSQYVEIPFEEYFYESLQARATIERRELSAQEINEAQDRSLQLYKQRFP